MIVVDASVIVKWFVEEPGHGEALTLTMDGERLVAPDFAILETLNVLRRKLRVGALLQEQLAAASRVLPGYFDRLVSASAVARDAIASAARLDHSVYDCAYLACSKLVDAPLVTADIRFAEKAEHAGYAKITRRLDES